MLNGDDTAEGQGLDEAGVEGAGDSLGEAKWAAMKELEPRFPGITIECVRFEEFSDGVDGPARVRGRSM